MASIASTCRARGIDYQKRVDEEANVLFLGPVGTWFTKMSTGTACRSPQATKAGDG